MFIVLDGIDGSGKGTQVRLLGEALTGRGHRVHLTCEPSSLPVGALLRRYLRRELTEDVPGWAGLSLLFAADRMQHVEQEIEPRLAAGEIVVCDRYDASSLAYQSAMRGDRAEETFDWIAVLNQHARRPDLTILLDLDPEVAQRRRQVRGNDGELLEAIELQARVRERYRQLGRVRPLDRIVHVDATPSVTEVHAEVWRAVLSLLEERNFPAPSRD